MTEYMVQTWIEDVGDGEGPWICTLDDTMIVEANDLDLELGWARFFCGRELVLAIPTRFIREITKYPGGITTYGARRKAEKKARKKAFRKWLKETGGV